MAPLLDEPTAALVDLKPQVKAAAPQLVAPEPGKPSNYFFKEPPPKKKEREIRASPERPQWLLV